MLTPNQFELWLKEYLVCPRDHRQLRLSNDDTLICPLQHIYPIIDGIPIMLLDDKPPTQTDIFTNTQDTVKSYRSLHKSILMQNIPKSDSYTIDAYVQKVISATCGMTYVHLINKLKCYPIPKLPLSPGKGECFLDLGCNWGRWCISANRLGYITIGVDPNFDAIMAARRVAQQLGVRVYYYLVADARYLPFPKNSFDVIFSYSVLQHFSEDDLNLCLSGISRTLNSSGICLCQMPNAFGLRNIYHQLKRRFKDPRDFEVRYRKPSKLKKSFTAFIGQTSLSVDGFFSLNAQANCKDMLPFWYRFVIGCSDILRKTSEKIKWLKYSADSLYVKSIKQ